MEGTNEKKSAIVNVTIMMFLVLVTAFTICNTISCKIMEAKVAEAKGVSIDEVRKTIGGTVLTLTGVSTGIGIMVLIILAVIMYISLVKPLMLGAKEIERVAEYDLTVGNDLAKMERQAACFHI